MCKMIRFLDVQRCVISSPPKKEVLRAAVGAQGFLERGLLSSGDMPRLFEDDGRLQDGTAAQFAVHGLLHDADSRRAVRLVA